MAKGDYRQANNHSKSDSFDIDPLTGEYFPTGDKQVVTANSPEPTTQRILTDSELALLATLPDGDLRLLVERILRQYGLVACLTEAEVFQAGLDRLATIMLSLPNSDAKDIANIFDKWCDRTRGRPAQAILQATVDTKTIIEIVRYGNAKAIDVTASALPLGSGVTS